MRFTSTPDELELKAYIRPWDRIVVGQACGEPVTLVQALIEQSCEIAELSVFIGSSFSGLFIPESTRNIALCSMGAIGKLRLMAQAGRLRVIPIHMSEIGPAIESGNLGCDVAFVQLSEADARGYHSCGLVSDHVRAAINKARVVIAEINSAIPFTHGETVHASEIDLAIRVDRPPLEIAVTAISEADRAIARHCSAFIGDGSVLQTGVGTLPDAILGALADRRDLGVHSGMLGDGFAYLAEAGVITNARKEIDTGISVTTALVGTRKLYDHADRNLAIRMSPASYTHDARVLAQLSGLVTINSALEVDLTGQVNSECVGDAYFGAAGGLVDFTRAGSRSPGGHGIIALPSTAMAGSASRIVSRLDGPVTLARTDVDIIVTEFGAAELKGCSLGERARRMAAIAHPDFREELDRSAFALGKKGL